MDKEKEAYTTVVEASEKSSGLDLDTALTTGDVALQVIAHTHQEPYSPKEEKKVIRKIDLHLIPFMFFSYFLQFMDKNALSNSSVFGLMDDLNLSEEQYSWCGSLFYFGYLIGQPVAARFLQRFPIGKFVGVCFVLWSIVLICTAAAKNFAGLAVIRIFLGVCEATVSPAWLLLTGMWYKKTEVSLVNCGFYEGNALGVIFGGLIAYGLGHIKSAIAPWKWFYIIYGILSFFWGFVIFFFLPGSIVECNFLNEREKYIAVERLRANRTGVKNKTFKKYQFKEALLDINVWLLAILEFVGCLPAGGVQNFGNLIIKSFGFTSFQTVLINMPSGVIQGLTLLISGLLLSKYPNCAIIVLSLCNIPCLIGTCLVKYLPNHPEVTRNGKLVAFYIIYMNTMSDIALLTLIQRNISGFTKKSTSGAIFFIAYCIGMIAAPHFFKDAPHYSMGFRMMIVCWVLLIVLPWILYVYLKRENAKRTKDEAAAAAAGKDTAVENEEFLDLTDKQQLRFRYTL